MEAFVHMTGFVGGDVELRHHNPAVASFRLACTPRVRRSGEWVDGGTTWLTVTCYRALAEHAAASVHRGDPLIVIGKLRTNVYTKEGQVYERTTLEAITLGHDLTRGTAVFRKLERPATEPEDRDGDLNDLHESVESQSRDDEVEEDPAGRRDDRAA